MKRSLKVSVPKELAKVFLIARCDQIINDNERLLRQRDGMRVKILILHAGGCNIWSAFTSAPNALYRMLKSVEGVERVCVEIVRL